MKTKVKAKQENDPTRQVYRKNINNHESVILIILWPNMPKQAQLNKILLIRWVLPLNLQINDECDKIR